MMEYMALGNPIVQYNGIEGKFSAQKASVYIKNNHVSFLGEAINYLLKDKERRKDSDFFGRKRVEICNGIFRKELIRIYKEILF